MRRFVEISDSRAPARSFPVSVAWAFLSCACIISLGVGCTGSGNGKSASAPTASGASEAARSGGPQIMSLAQVPTTDMTEAEQRLWADLINDQLSPCGDPRSVAKCASEGTKCGACVTAARYLARLVMEGYDRSTIVDHYKTRFGSTKLEIPTTDAPSRGAPMAKVTIVEFSDFQCPHCGAAHPELVRVLKEFDGSVRLVYRYFPLSNHTRALPAAKAAEAARTQGKFWEMHDALFENQRALEDADLDKYAKQLGLDVSKFDSDMTSDAADKRVQSDRELGQKLGIEATPSFFVNGRPFREGIRSLPAYLKEELEL
ncbi:MAG TPA: thioredoxin domain-containing protein [Polyangiales bacterium]|jgi:protein-disulfide isomerase|nr:thioredoxin domain-containing protein [Polyangiales bacterium]